MKTTFVPICLLALPIAFASSSAFAKSDPEYAGTAVQQRKYQLFHEFRLAVGSMPLDAYQKSWTGSFSYTVHLSDYWAWEIFQATGALLTSTSLRDELVSTFAVPPDDFAAPRFMATTGLEFSPFYGKQVFMNDGVLHSDLIFGAYGGVIFGDRGDIAKTLEDFRPAIGLGLGFRFFVSKLASVRADVRQFFSAKRAIQDNEDFAIEPVLFLTLSFSLNVWRDDA